MNYKSFTQIVVLGSRNFVPFMQLSTADRRSVIEDLLDIQIFSTMATLLKDKVSDNKNALQQIDYEINLIEEKIKMEADYLAQMKEDKGAERKKLEQTINDKQGDLETLQNAVESLQAQVETLLNDIKDKDKLSKKSDKYLQLESAITQKLKGIQKQKQFFVDNDHCPTCDQDIDEGLKTSKISEADASISETEEGLAQLEEQLSSISATLVSYRGIQEQIDELNTETVSYTHLTLPTILLV